MARRPDGHAIHPAGPHASIQQTKARLARYHEHQTAHGFSKRIILDRGSARPLGDAGLLVLKEYGWIDLGFRQAQSYWGKGLATEAASAWVQSAFNEFHIDRLDEFVHPGNVASIRVAGKVRVPYRRAGNGHGNKLNSLLSRYQDVGPSTCG